MECGVKNPSPKELSPQETWWLHLESPLSPDDKTQLLIGMEDWDRIHPQACCYHHCPLEKPGPAPSPSQEEVNLYGRPLMNSKAGSRHRSVE